MFLMPSTADTATTASATNQSQIGLNIVSASPALLSQPLADLKRRSGGIYEELSNSTRYVHPSS